VVLLPLPLLLLPLVVVCLAAASARCFQSKIFDAMGLDERALVR
jgi:cytosine/uracil/thiamine/allantoin permease